MEEKYSELTGIVHEYMEKDMTYKDFKEAIDYWVDDYIANNNSNLKPFSLEAAKAGKPVCTRDRKKVRIICFDLKNNNNPIVAAVGNDSCETLLCYTKNGKLTDGIDSVKDLMMLPEKKEGWVNVYQSGSSFKTSKSIFNSKEEAVKFKEDVREEEYYVDTIKIIWKE